MKKFYEDYSHLSIIKLKGNESVKDVAQEVQNHIENFISIRDKKKIDDLEEIRNYQNLQKEKEEELMKKTCKEKEVKEAEALIQTEIKQAVEIQKSIIQNYKFIILF